VVGAGRSGTLGLPVELLVVPLGEKAVAKGMQSDAAERVATAIFGSA